MRRRRAGTKMPCSVSVKTSPSTAIWPCSGRRRPAIALISEVLPAPERPKRAVRPPALSNAASRTKLPKWCSTATLSTSEPLCAACRPLDQDLGGQQGGERDRDRHKRQPQRRKIAAGDLDQRIDRGRQRLGFAGDVRDEGDRRAKLAKRAGKGEDHAGDDPRQDQRQGDRGEHPERIGAERPGDRKSTRLNSSHSQISYAVFCLKK